MLVFPSKLRFENRIDSLCSSFPQSSALKIKILNRKIQASLILLQDFYLFVTTEGFKPPTAGAEIQCSIQLSYVAWLYYANFALTIVDIVFPSAFPASSLLTIPITFPISFIPLAPSFSMVATTIFSISSSLIASGKN